MHALRDVQSRTDTTVIFVTHDMDIAAQMNRLITLVDGKVASDDPRSTAQLAAVSVLREKRSSRELKIVGG